jgi:hypothetical protein
MTEEEWLASQDPEEMRWQLRYYSDSQVSDRKLRLYGCACCRRIWHNLVDPRSKAAVEAAEELADGLTEDDEVPLPGEDEPEVMPVTEQRQMSRVEFDRLDPAKRTELSAAWAAHAVNRADDGWQFYDHLEDVISHCLEAAKAQAFGLSQEALAGTLADLLRDVVGNPFRAVGVDSSWLTPTVRSLAEAAYDTRNLPSGNLESARLVVLADALEEAGCSEEDILDHLRSPGPHVRGCWPLDQLLKKE